jgi:hypothetical protein
MKILFLSFAAMAMLSFSSVSETIEEDFGDCPANSTEIRATCTKGCYSVINGGTAQPLSPSQTDEAERRLQNYCNNRPIVELIAPAPRSL